MVVQSSRLDHCTSPLALLPSCAISSLQSILPSAHQVYNLLKIFHVTLPTEIAALASFLDATRQSTSELLAFQASKSSAPHAPWFRSTHLHTNSISGCMDWRGLNTLVMQHATGVLSCLLIGGMSFSFHSKKTCVCLYSFCNDLNTFLYRHDLG